MGDKQSDPLEKAKTKLLRIRPILWFVILTIAVGLIAAALTNLQTIIAFFSPPAASISVASIALDPNRCIFEGETSFQVSKQMRGVLMDLVFAAEAGKDPEEALSKMRHAIDRLFYEQDKPGPPIRSEELRRIFQKKDGRALLRLLTPADPKSPRYKEFNESRSELFAIVPNILTDELLERERVAREYVKPFRPLLMGLFEPILNITVYNGGGRTAIINEVDVEVKTALALAALVPSGAVTAAETVDVTLPAEPGRSRTLLSRTLQISPDSALVIPVRIRPETPSLQEYKLRIIVKGQGVEASTEDFWLEM